MSKSTEKLVAAHALNNELKSELNYVLIELHQSRAEVERVKACCERGDKMLQQVKRDRDEAREQVEALKNYFGNAKKISSPEPSRLEIAAMFYAADIAAGNIDAGIDPDMCPFNALDHADALIKAAKEAK